MPVRPEARRARAAPAALALLAVAAAAPAGDWTITPGLSTSETYSDNIGLAAPGEERHDFVTSVSPSVRVRGIGRRLSLNLDYSLQRLSYARDSEPLKLNHTLQTDGVAELYDQIAFLEFRATSRQENSSSTGRLADSSISANSGVADVMTWSVAPVFRHRLGNWVVGEVRYEVAEVVSSNPGQGSKVRSETANFASGERFANLPWSLDYSSSRSKSERGTSTEFMRISAEGRYRYTRTYGIVFGGGVERNEFASASADTGGPTWKLGATWNPTPRTSGEFGIENRFFDLAYFATFRHRARRTVIELNYSEDTSTSSRQQLDRQLIPLVDAFGDPIVDPGTGQPLAIAVDTLTPSEEVVVARRFRANVTYRGRRNGGSIAMFDETRTAQLAGTEERVFGASFQASRTLSRQTTAGASGSWQSTESASAVDQTRWDVGLSLSHRINRDLTAVLDVRHLSQDSDSPANVLEENRLSLRLSMAF